MQAALPTCRRLCYTNLNIAHLSQKKRNTFLGVFFLSAVCFTDSVKHTIGSDVIQNNKFLWIPSHAD